MARARLVAASSVVSVLLVLVAADARAQACAPGACAATFHHVSFESIAPGTSVEGAGAVDAALTITSLPWAAGSPACATGSAAVIEETNSVPFASYVANPTVTNGCLNGVRGFGDEAECVLDYEFTLAPGRTASCFGIRIFDFGDYYPFGGTHHVVTLSAYDASNTLVDTDVLAAAGAVDLAFGDACSTQPGTSGNFFLSVAAPGIVRVTLTFDEFPDPNVGFDDITFCESEAPTPAVPASWGTVKAAYHR